MNQFNDFNFSGIRALIRVDFNVPIKDGKITDGTRINAALPTIEKVLKDGGSVILMSHWGRPLKDMEKKPHLTLSDFTLAPVAVYLSEKLSKPVTFVADSMSEEASQKAASLKPGEVMLLENLRYYKQEEKGDRAFAEKLSKLGDVYINDAFGTAHRAHASTAIIADFFSPDKKMFGYLMENEVKAAEQVLHNSQKPFTAIIGGAKVSDKILIIENLLEKATDIIIGGGMAYTFFKAQGCHIGNSLCEDDRLETAANLLQKAAEKGVSIHLPSDSIIADKFDAQANTSSANNSEIPEGWMGLDVGQIACDTFSKVIRNSKTILWNGPMGVFEMEKFQHGTKCIADAVADATAEGAFSLVGGGDSVAAVNKFGYADKVSYVSTGGGAMLEFFEGKVLPGIAAINQ
ncbi:MAG: phosphoglycerate kinase [Bacteroidetes bacterium]|nr:phosphoglycerate kinase [Bacteroidota bacterium]